MSKTALVTGGAGYIGNHVVALLLQNRWDVVILDDLSSGNPDAINPAAKMHRGDICDSALVADVFKKHKIDVVFHLAAVSSVPASFDDPARCREVNEVAGNHLVDAAAANGVKFFVFSSTSAVYDQNGKPPFKEADALRPISPYAETKLAAERYLQAHSGVKSVTLRFFNVGGADPKFRAGNYKQQDTTLIKVAMECAIGKRAQLNIFGTDYPTPDGTCIRDYVHVTDVARGNLAAADYLLNGGSSEVLNIGVGRGFSVLEVVNAVKSVTQVDFPTNLTARREGDPAIVYCDPAKAERVLDFAAERSDLTQIVADAWRWEQHLSKLGAS